MPFLVIGGHAVNAYGISRQTADLDLVAPISTKPEWTTLMSKLRYVPGQNDDRFARYRPESLANWPIDLMYVADATFETLNRDSVSFDFGATRASVISARHLVAMKLHALKVYQEHRHAKDLTDVVELLRSGKTGLSDDDLKQLCLKYATIEMYTKLSNELKRV